MQNRRHSTPKFLTCASLVQAAEYVVRARLSSILEALAAYGPGNRVANILL